MIPLSAYRELLDIVTNPTFDNLYSIVPILSEYPPCRISHEIVDALQLYVQELKIIHLFKIEEICRDQIRLRLLEEID